MKQALNDYSFWQKTNSEIIRRIHALIDHIEKTPFKGIGKPEPLKHQLTGWWSRRINREHRLVYQVREQTIIIAQCRYHY